LDLAMLSASAGVSEAALIVALCGDELGQDPSDFDGDVETGRTPLRAPSGGVALVTAARRRPEDGRDTDPKELLLFGGRPLLVHSLKALEEAGVEVAVVLVGNKGGDIVECVQETRFCSLRVDFIDLGEDWAGSHAQSILQARKVVDAHCRARQCPCLLVTSDHLFDPRLLRRVLAAGDPRSNALVVEERSPQDVGLLHPTSVRVRTRWEDPSAADPTEAGLRSDGAPRRWCLRLGRRLEAYDSIDAGLALLGGSTVWDELQAFDNARPQQYFTLAKALDAVARNGGALAAIGTDGAKWFAVETDDQLEFTYVSLR
jgi:choline kinase